MSYRCDVCDSVAPHNQSCLKHLILKSVPRRKEYRPYVWDGHNHMEEVEHPNRTDIAKELKVCKRCYDALKLGVPLPILMRQKGTPKVVKRIINPPKSTDLPNVTTLKEWPEQKPKIKSYAEEYGMIEPPVLKPEMLRKFKVAPPPQSTIKCDVCGSTNTANGQRTNETILCITCAEKARQMTEIGLGTAS